MMHIIYINKQAEYLELKEENLVREINDRLGFIEQLKNELEQIKILKELVYKKKLLETEKCSK